MIPSNIDTSTDFANQFCNPHLTDFPYFIGFTPTQSETSARLIVNKALSVVKTILFCKSVGIEPKTDLRYSINKEVRGDFTEYVIHFPCWSQTVPTGHLRVAAGGSFCLYGLEIRTGSYTGCSPFVISACPAGPLFTENGDKYKFRKVTSTNSRDKTATSIIAEKIDP